MNQKLWNWPLIIRKMENNQIFDCFGAYLVDIHIYFIFHKTYLFDNCEFLVYFETMKSLENLIENNKDKIEKYKCQEYIRFVRIARRMNLRIVTFEKAAQSAKQLSN